MRTVQSKMQVEGAFYNISKTVHCFPFKVYQKRDVITFNIFTKFELSNANGFSQAANCVYDKSPLYFLLNYTEEKFVDLCVIQWEIQQTFIIHANGRYRKPVCTRRIKLCEDGKLGDISLLVYFERKTMRSSRNIVNSALNLHFALKRCASRKRNVRFSQNFHNFSFQAHMHLITYQNYRNINRKGVKLSNLGFFLPFQQILHTRHKRARRTFMRNM